MEDITPDRPDLDRRTLIRRAGIVTAGVAAWSAPAITTLAPGAHAAGSPAPSCTDCGACNGNRCGPDCSCVPRVGGGDCVCHQGTPCSQLQPCTTQADCATGTCAQTCCFTPVCVPDCAGATGARRAALPEHGTTISR